MLSLEKREMKEPEKTPLTVPRYDGIVKIEQATYKAIQQYFKTFQREEHR